MSHKIVTLVYSRRVGSPHRKAILAYMADRASDDGSGVFCSKGTIVKETEIARSTVFKTISDMVEEGILIEAGHRPCKNGSTVVYDLNLDAISAFPEVKSDAKTSLKPDPTSPGAGPVQGGTSPGAGPHQSGSRTPTGPGAGPKPSLEPPLNTEAAVDAREVDHSLVGKLTHALGFDHHGVVPKYWAAPDTILIVGRWQTDLGLTPDEILHVAVANLRQHGSPANGPKILTRHMQDYAAAKNTKLTPTPIEGGTDNARRQAPYVDRRQKAANDAFAKRIATVARARPIPGGDWFDG